MMGKFMVNEEEEEEEEEKKEMRRMCLQAYVKLSK
jgi:hypothetical protein